MRKGKATMIENSRALYELLKEYPEALNVEVYGLVTNALRIVVGR